MNKKLNISERDKKLLTILVILLVAFLCYYFVLNPALIERDALKAAYSQAEEEYNRVETLISSLTELKKERTAKLDELQEKYKVFIYEINEPRILYKLDTVMAEAGFPVRTVSFTQVSASEIAVDTADYQPLVYPLYLNASKTNPTLTVPKREETDESNSDNSKEKERTTDAVAYTDVTLEFSDATYEGIYSFLQKLEGLDRSIIVKKLEIGKADTAAMTGQVLLEIYSVAKPNKSDSSDLQFDNVLPKGKVNPFQ